MSTDESSVLVSQGAEGKVYYSQFYGRPSVEKVRISKRYRVKELDIKLNKHRILQESRCIAKCVKWGISVPCLYNVDIPNNKIIQERVIGQTVKDYFQSHQASGYGGDCEDIATRIGEMIGKMHDIDVIHGDLTTSNIMIREGSHQTVLIDFGLGAMQAIIEDKAVDIYVLERAMLSTHPGCEKLISAVLQAYRFACRQGTVVLLKLEQVRLRGRKREAFG